MIVRSVAIGVALALTWTTSALAEPDYAHQGPYVQLSGGVTAYSTAGSVEAADGLLGAKIGIDIVDHVALELQYEGLPGPNVHSLTFQQRTRILTGRWQPYLVWGMGWGIEDTSYFAVRVGGGLDFMVTEKVSVGAEFGQVFLVNGSHYGGFSFGARYGF